MKPCRQDNDRPQRPKSFSGQTSAWTTWQFTCKAFACAVHPKMKEVFGLATRKGADLVNARDITGELQSQSTQLYFFAGDDSE